MKDKSHSGTEVKFLDLTGMILMIPVWILLHSGRSRLSQLHVKRPRGGLSNHPGASLPESSGGSEEGRQAGMGEQWPWGWWDLLPAVGACLCPWFLPLYWEPVGIMLACELCFHMQAQSCLTLGDPMVRGPPGSSVHGIFRQEHCSGLPCPPAGNLPDPGVNPSRLSCIGRRVLYHCTTCEALGVGLLAPDQEQNSLAPCPLRASSLLRKTDIKPTATYRSTGANCGKKEDLAGPRGSRESCKGTWLCCGLVKPMGRKWSLAWDVKMDEELASWGKEETVDQAGRRGCPLAPTQEGLRHPVEPGSRVGWVSVVSSAFWSPISTVETRCSCFLCWTSIFPGKEIISLDKEGSHSFFYFGHK